MASRAHDQVFRSPFFFSHLSRSYFVFLDILFGHPIFLRSSFPVSFFFSHLLRSYLFFLDILSPRRASAAGAGGRACAADLQPILEHLRDVVTGPEHLDFLLAWLAQQVQDPAHHTWRSRPSCRFRSTARARLPTSRERDWCMQERNIAQHPALLQVPLGRDPAGRRVSHGARYNQGIDVPQSVPSSSITGGAPATTARARRRRASSGATSRR